MTNIPQAYKYRYNGVIYIGGALPDGAELLETINRIDEKTAQTIETMDIVDPKADKSDLDGKANIDLSNINTAGKSFASKLGMPSSRYIDLTLGASGATYTAPANGWFVIRKRASASGQYWYFGNESAGDLCYSISTHNNDQTVEAFIPAKSGDIIRIGYNLGGSTSFFRFVYAEGEENV